MLNAKQKRFSSSQACNRLSRLEAQAGTAIGGGGAGPSVDVAVELEELRAKLVATELERDEARSARACKRQATAVVCEGTPIPESSVPLRSREDFVPMCEEDVFRWMQEAGNGHEVARLCHVLGTAATNWSTPTPSMLSNAVQR